MGGEIKDLLLLEDRILEVEAKLQDLGVDIGVYSTENSFCTINFALRETAQYAISIRFVLSCAKSSLTWTLSVFAVTLFVVAAALFALWIILLLVNNIKWPSRANNADTNEQDKDEITN